jgi:DNA-binding MarR family transcriptional regulator
MRRPAAVNGPRTRPSASKRDAAALHRVMTDLLRVYQFRDRDRLGYYGLTITQHYVLDVLIQRGALTLNELATEMGLDKSTLSRVVDGLERKRAAKRIANPADGRSTLIDVTRSGKQRRERAVADLVAENAKVLSTFTSNTRRQFVVLIADLTRAARERELSRVNE